MTLILILTSLIIGAIIGSIVVTRWYVSRLDNPEVARAILKNVYRKSHPHWLQRSKEDGAKVCPCCGWSETESLAGHGS